MPVVVKPECDPNLLRSTFARPKSKTFVWKAPLACSKERPAKVIIGGGVESEPESYRLSQVVVGGWDGREVVNALVSSQSHQNYAEDEEGDGDDDVGKSHEMTVSSVWRWRWR